MDFQILRFNYRVIGVADIFLGPVLSEILGEGFLRGLVEARERGLRGTEVFPEEGHGLRRAEGIVEVQFLLLGPRGERFFPHLRPVARRRPFLRPRVTEAAFPAVVERGAR